MSKKVPKGLEKLDSGLKKMKEPCLIKRIVDEVQKEGVIGEEDTIMAVTLKIMLRLVKNATPTSSNVVISDESGGGKDWITKCICNVLLKPKDYFHRSRLTEKVFTYWHAKEKNFTWDGKVIHLEDPDPEFLNSQAFKVRASGETEETIIKKQKAVDVKVVGKPVIIVTSLTASMNIESVRRWDSCRVDTSDELTKQIMRRNALVESGLLKIEKDEGLREALQNLQPKKVVIPYAVAIAEALPCLLGMRTQHHKFLDYIKASAVLHQHQRKKTEDGEIIANIFDYEYARFCFYKFGNMKGVPLNIAEEHLLDVLLQNGHPMDIQSILPQIDRGSTWLYDKIDRLKELKCIKEVYIYNDQAQKDIKHLVANERMAWKTIIGGNEIIKEYKKMIDSGQFLGLFGAFPVNKKDLSNGRKMSDFEGGFPEFQKCVYIVLKDNNNISNNIYNTYIQKNGKPPTQQEEEGIGKGMERVRKAYGMDSKTLSQRLNELRTFVETNKEGGYKITKKMLVTKFDEPFINKCIDKGILIKNGDEYICT
jgi:hypothetical protein